MTSERAPQDLSTVPSKQRAMALRFALCEGLLTSSKSTKRCSRRKLVDCCFYDQSLRLQVPRPAYHACKHANVQSLEV